MIVVLFAAEPTMAQRQRNAPPNIIFILVDDLGIGDIGVYYQNDRKAQGKRNMPYMQTPHIDQMATRGALVHHGYANAPVCVSSRASILLGLTQGHTQVRDNQFDKALDRNYNMANTLKQAGYTTAAIGKWGLQGTDISWPAHPLKVGFDYYYGYIRHVDGHEHYPKEGKYRGVKEMYDGYENVTPTLDKCYTADLWTARAKQWIVAHSADKRNRNKPFFMYLAFDTPHAVIELPTQAYPEGRGLKGGMQWIGEPGHMINTASGEIDSWLAPEYANATWDHDGNASTPEVPWPDVNKRYATVVKRMDDHVGDLLALLKDLRIDDNTLVVFTCDNGPSQESYLAEDYSPEFFRGYGHFDGIKRDLWEGGIRVPNLVQWPGKIKPGTVVNTPMIASDWMATFLDAAGVGIPAKLDGVSVLPSLTGTGTRSPSLIYAEYYQNQQTPRYADFEASRRGRTRGQMQFVRIGDHAGVRYDIQSPADPFEIYDVVNDPKEITNLAGDSRYAELQMTMQQRTTQMRRSNAEAKRPYDQVPVAAVPGSSSSEFSVARFESTSPWVSNAYGLTAKRSWAVNAINATLFSEGQGVYRITGFIDAPQDGAYTFYFKADGQAVMKLHDMLVIDADFAYTGNEKQETVMLKAGRHPFRFYYKPKAGPARESFSLQWSGPGFERKPVANEAAK